MKTVIAIFIRAYQLTISPMLPAACRFQPSCSDYALEAVRKHGIIKGTYKAVCRLLRCHPFSKKQGWDPV